LTAEYFICPNCGAEVTQGASACPECGSDDATGWSEETLYDGIDLPEFEEAYDATNPPSPRSGSLFQNRAFIVVIALVTLLVFILVYIL
jgi:hypothetical protein